ncbi:hypothetical protein H4582DRAFT_1270274 [Lactarius indigo]|nr:hypothetical protein H4582DRAFT_1270274 [Lactarius indigo]
MWRQVGADVRGQGRRGARRPSERANSHVFCRTATLSAVVPLFSLEKLLRHPGGTKLLFTPYRPFHHTMAPSTVRALVLQICSSDQHRKGVARSPQQLRVCWRYATLRSAVRNATRNLTRDNVFFFETRLALLCSDMSRSPDTMRGDSIIAQTPTATRHRVVRGWLLSIDSPRRLLGAFPLD